MSDNQHGAPGPTFKAAMLAALPSLRAFAMSLTGRPDRADDLVQ
jgi:RNA polymerase sigma-70 factor, ECF subfamily